MKKRLLAALLSAVLLTTGTLPALAEEDSNAVETDVIVVEDSETEETESIFSPEDSDASESEVQEIVVEDSSAEEISAEQEVLVTTETQVNPLYADIIDESDLLPPAEIPSDGSRRSSTRVVNAASDQYTADQTEIVSQIRDAMRDHVQDLSVYVLLPEYSSSLARQWIAQAKEETDSPIEGDYISWNYAGISWTVTKTTVGGVDKTDANGNRYYTVCFTFTYYTTAEQENELSNAVDSLLNEFAFTESTSDYTKIRTIYQYICQNVDYDRTNNEGYLLSHTAYAALIDGTAVCQGYASLLYRMLRQEGISCRIIASETHGWNIAKIGEQYYNLDATWDADTDSHRKYFLLGANDPLFLNDSHTRLAEYTSKEFEQCYPMADVAYASEDSISVRFTWSPNAERTDYTCIATVTDAEETVTSHSCTVTRTAITPVCKSESDRAAVYTASVEIDGITYTDTKKITGTHTLDAGVVTIEPTCTARGVRTYTCDNCGATRTATISAGHTIVHVPASAATCQTEGNAEYWKCTACDACFSNEEGTKPTTEADITISKLPHSFTDYRFNNDATCTKDGTETASCDYGCGTTDTKTISGTATGHAYGKPTFTWTGTDSCKADFLCGNCEKTQTVVCTITAETTAATCTTDGKTVYTATASLEGASGTDTKTETIAAKGHTSDGGTVIREPTCRLAGMRLYVCVDCGEKIKEQTIPATKKHTYKTVITKAKPGTNGKIVERCSVCENVKSTTTISAPKTVKLSKTSYIYDKKTKKPTVTVKDAAGKTIAASNYSVTYASGRKNVGSYKVTVKFKSTSKNYTDSLSTTFQINPKGTTLKSVAAAKKGFTAKWTKQATQTTGYQIQYATNSKFTSGAKTVTVSKNKTVSKKITKLKAKKKYYVRIRTYKTVSGKKYYSSWSKAKTVTTKK
ncbi:MAG: transglutaminase domain-containing protein [Eubacteriales bacterium]|nr:transglutaminase domain-containing protein [Eubacteriales bacterium]